MAIDPKTGCTPDDLLDTIGDLQGDVATLEIRNAALTVEVERLTAERDQAVEGELERADERNRALDHVRALEARALAAESSAARLREVLRGVEWVDTSGGEGDPECPVCGAIGAHDVWAARHRDDAPYSMTLVPAEPHKDGCALAAALAGT